MTLGHTNVKINTAGRTNNEIAKDKDDCDLMEK